ncbi:MAG: DUF4142 domain-containing protein [Bacteroidota bacterium]|nr:DUF4142 domain-containing protein [Bacteroidota bacterium]
MKKLSFASLIAGALLFSACNGSSTKTDSDSSSDSSSTKTMATDSNRMSSDTNRMGNMSTDTSKNSSMSNTPVDSNTKDFANEAAAGGMMEVQLGNIAVKNGASQSVKDFGQMMVDDHTKVNNQMKDLAGKKNITLPSTVTDKQQKEIDNLSKKTGADFDKAYVNMMVDDHKNDIAAFKKAGNKVNDADFKSFITNALPTLQKHLDAIENIKKKM